MDMKQAPNWPLQIHIKKKKSASVLYQKYLF